MRTLVTGAGGFVGSALVRGLVDKGHEVRALVRPHGSVPTLPQGVERFRGDVRFRESLIDAVRGCEAVFHLAARMGGNDLEDYREVNVYGSEQVARAASEVGQQPRLIAMSSVSAMGPSSFRRPGPRKETDIGPLPSDGYGLSKREMEERLRPLCEELGLGLDMVRPGIVYGPGGKGLIPDLVHDVSARRIHRMGRGKNRLGLVFIEHLIDACISLLDHPPSGEAFVVVDPDPPSLDELLSAFARATGQRLPFRRWGRREAQVRGLISMIMAKRTGRPTSITKSRIPVLMADQWFDGSKLREYLGNPSLQPFEVCVRRTVDWTLSGTRSI